MPLAYLKGEWVNRNGGWSARNIKKGTTWAVFTLAVKMKCPHHSVLIESFKVRRGILKRTTLSEAWWGQVKMEVMCLHFFRTEISICNCQEHKKNRQKYWESCVQIVAHTSAFYLKISNWNMAYFVITIGCKQRDKPNHHRRRKRTCSCTDKSYGKTSLPYVNMEPRSPRVVILGSEATSGMECNFPQCFPSWGGGRTFNALLPLTNFRYPTFFCTS